VEGFPYDGSHWSEISKGGEMNGNIVQLFMKALEREVKLERLLVKMFGRQIEPLEACDFCTN